MDVDRLLFDNKDSAAKIISDILAFYYRSLSHRQSPHIGSIIHMNISDSM